MCSSITFFFYLGKNIYIFFRNSDSLTMLFVQLLWQKEITVRLLDIYIDFTTSLPNSLKSQCVRHSINVSNEGLLMDCVTCPIYANFHYSS